MVSLTKITGLAIEQTLAVNSIVEVSTYCTSILAKTKEGDVVHVRNLDFGYANLMRKLVHYEHLVKGGVTIAYATGISGFYGVYTGRKPNAFSVSYNVRETTDKPDPKVLQ